MSGRRVKRLGESNSALIHQINGSIPTDFYSVAAVKALLDIDIANKRWMNLGYVGQVAGRGEYVQHYRNTGASDAIFCFEPPIPYIISDGVDTYNLVITQVRIAVGDADAGDYINNIFWFGQSAYDNEDQLYTDGTNRTAPGLYTYDHGDLTIGGSYEKVYLYVACVNTNAADLDIEYLQFEYYYVKV